MRRLAAASALAAGLVVATVAGCGSDGPDATLPSVTQAGSASGSATAPAVTSVVAASLHEPIVLLPRPGDDGHLWVAERAGTVRRLTVEDDGNTLASPSDPLLDLTEETTTESERGLLGMAFSRDGDVLYVSHTDADGNSRVAAYDVTGSVDHPKIDAASRKVLFAVDQPFPNHNGGNIAFGPDGKLWLGLGDGGAADDPGNRAQDPDVPLGKVLTIDPASGQHAIVISGVRNPWRWAFDTDGSLWIADVGQNRTEEIDHLAPDAIDGANLGWSGYEGSTPYLDGDGRRPDDAIGPVFEYQHTDGNCSITGGFPYHGSAIPDLEGAYVFADYCAGKVRAITLGDDGKLAHEWDLGVSVEQPISFGQDQAGELYVLSATGNVVRLIPKD